MGRRLGVIAQRRLVSRWSGRAGTAARAPRIAIGRPTHLSRVAAVMFRVADSAAAMTWYERAFAGARRGPKR